MKSSLLISILISLFFAFTACTSIPETEDGDSTQDEEILSSDNEYSEELSQMEKEDSTDTDNGDDMAASGDEPEEEDDEDAAAATTAETEPEPAPAPKPKKTSRKAKSAMRILSQDCNMRSKPSSKGKKIKVIRGGKKLWTEDGGRKYFKVYRKSGAAYISKSCF